MAVAAILIMAPRRGKISTSSAQRGEFRRCSDILGDKTRIQRHASPTTVFKMRVAGAYGIILTPGRVFRILHLSKMLLLQWSVRHPSPTRSSSSHYEVRLESKCRERHLAPSFCGLEPVFSRLFSQNENCGTRSVAIRHLRGLWRRRSSFVFVIFKMGMRVNRPLSD